MLGLSADGLVLLAWALAFAALGTRVAIRRDITQRDRYARPRQEWVGHGNQTRSPSG
jgi:hypothetical protein